MRDEIRVADLYCACAMHEMCFHRCLCMVCIPDVDMCLYIKTIPIYFSAYAKICRINY